MNPSTICYQRTRKSLFGQVNSIFGKIVAGVFLIWAVWREKKGFCRDLEINFPQKSLEILLQTSP